MAGSVVFSLAIGSPIVFLLPSLFFVVIVSVFLFRKPANDFFVAAAANNRTSRRY